MRRWRPLLLLVVGLGVLAVSGCQDRESDSLMAAHQAFATRLRSQDSGLPEAREVALPDVLKGETVLALATADDSPLLAVATSHRLLCLLIGNGVWAQWPLPRAIESAAALHVESDTGSAHLVVGDDGRMLTADCGAAQVPSNSASTSALIETASATQNQPAVAWFDPEEGEAWIAPVTPAGPEVSVTARSLSDATGETTTLKAAFPGDANPLFPNPAVIHSMAKIEDNILLFYGDANPFHDSDLRDESVLVISIDDPERSANKLVFAASAEEEKGGQNRWIITHVKRVLPASAPGRIYAVTQAPPGVVVLGADGKPVEVLNDSLFATEYREGDQVYDLTIKSSGKDATMEVSAREMGTRVSYELPWRFERRAELAAIFDEGRQAVVASAAGDILLIDLRKPAEH